MLLVMLDVVTADLSIVTEASGVGSAKISSFEEAGLTSPEDVGDLTIEELSNRVSGVGVKTAANVLRVLDEHGYRTHDVNQQNLDKLLSLLEDLFEFDKSDRDFGVYKLMNQRRGAIDNFINVELVEFINDEVSNLKESIGQERDISAKREAVVDALGEDAIRPDGQVRDEYRSVPVAQKYISAQEQDTTSVENVEAEIYNYVFEFFDRYYENGDFITQTYEVAGEKPYSVPYDGSNTQYHWVTKDQYYAKTTEDFTRFSFRYDGDTYVFQTEYRELTGEDGVGTDSYFVLASVDGNTAVFERRQLGESDLEEYGVSRNKQQKQSALNTEFADEVSAAFDIPTDMIVKKIEEYTTRNQNDFFIHKQLRGFLTTELERFVRDEVAGYDPASEFDGVDAVVRAQARIVNAVCMKITDFICQINNFKKKLFEKKKFVTSSHALVPVSEIDQDQYEAIVENGEQCSRWQTQYGVEDVTVEMLSTPPHNRMMVDTSLFTQQLTTRTPENILVHGENYQAQRFLSNRYQGSIKCIYIDPPYNTGNANFAYKDKYQRPTWLSLMKDRLELAYDLLSDDGVIVVHMDDSEESSLSRLLDEAFGEGNKLVKAVWDLGSSSTSGHFKPYHEYIMVYAKNKEALEYFDYADIEYLKSTNTDVISHGALKKISKKNPKSEVTIPAGVEIDGVENTTFTGSVGGSEKMYIKDEEMRFVNGELAEDTTVEAGWAMKDQLLQWINDERPVFDSKGQRILRFYFNNNGILQYDKERGTMHPPSVLDFPSTKAGTNQLEDVIGDASQFDFPKPVEIAKSFVELITSDGDTVLDFFAGSGTTAQAIQELNRERDATVNYILVEMLDDAFDITKERVSRVGYTSDWNDGHPQIGDETEGSLSVDGNEKSPAAVECLQLESYEQALDSVEFTDEQSRLSTHADHLLNYFLDFETQDSSTFLNTTSLATPTEYRLAPNAQSPISVDVMTTFRYLLGLQDTTETHRTIGGVEYTLHSGRVSTESAEDESVLVIWRHDATEVSHDVEQQEIDVTQYDSVYVNGDSTFDNAQLIAPEFERLMEVGQDD